MIASLPMYDRAETAGANDRLWALVRDRLRAGGVKAPDMLTRGGDPWDDWTDPALVLSQTCGFPYRAKLHERVTLVATPVCDIDAPPGHYFSVLVARRDDIRPDLADYAGSVFAYNEALSQSGWAAPAAHVARSGVRFDNLLRTGAHRASAAAVAEARADLAAIDALTWRMICRWDAFAEGLAEVGRTDPTPALPYIAAPGADAEAIGDALASAIASLSADDCDALGLRGVVRIPAADYLSVPTPPAPAAGRP